MSTDTAPDEQPKRKVAKRVVTEKRMYFVPVHGVSVEATDVDDAVKKAKASADSAEQEGDG